MTAFTDRAAEQLEEFCDYHRRHVEDGQETPPVLWIDDDAAERPTLMLLVGAGRIHLVLPAAVAMYRQAHPDARIIHLFLMADSITMVTDRVDAPNIDGVELQRRWASGDPTVQDTLVCYGVDAEGNALCYARSYRRPEPTIVEWGESRYLDGPGVGGDMTDALQRAVSL